MSVNKVILVGNVGREPEVRYVENNVAVANFSLATTERGYTTRAGVQVPDRTEWHNIVVWRGLAETVEKYVHKGQQLYIEGRIRTRNYEADGVTRYVTEIYADNLQMLGRRGDQPAGDDASAALPAAEPSMPKAAPAFTQSEVTDDLPF